MDPSFSDLRMNPTAAILSIGNEVLRGSVVNTNAAFLGCELTNLGFEVISHSVCADSQEAIRFRVGELVRRADLVVMMGGLGPTPDDVTREGVAAYFNTPLVLFEDQYRRIQKAYKHFGKRMPPLVKKEAHYPENAKPLLNRFGIALGFSITTQGKLIIALPGVPSELKNMFFDVVVPRLKAHYPKAAKKKKLIVKMVGISEPDVMKKLGDDFFQDDFDFGIYPSSGEVAIRILTREASLRLHLKRKIQTKLQDWIYAWDETPFSIVLGKIMTKKRQTLAVAESCSGGLLASEITRYSGASAFFQGAVVTYQRSAKQELGISEKTIQTYGEVSSQVAAGLAKWVRVRMNSSYGLGITGIAGPEGGNARKPVGLVYMALALPNQRVKVWKHLFWGDRNQIQKKAAVKALEHLWQQIR